MVIFFVMSSDTAYGIWDHVLNAFKGAHLTPEQIIFNKGMSKVRVSVEWGFGMISTYWAFCDFPKNQKIYLQHVGKQYVVAAILTNLLTCFYGSKTSTFFNMQPPTPEEYLASPVPENEAEQYDMLEHIPDIAIEDESE